MDQSALSSINRQVYQRFPELTGVKPRIKKQDVNTLLTYQGEVKISGSQQSGSLKSMARIVRVVVNPQNVIIKISTSR
jgi:hypothetical protein